jgi:chromosome segregation ATPase
LNKIVSTYNAKEVSAANARIAKLKAKRLRLSQKLSRNKKLSRTRRNKQKSLKEKILKVRANKKNYRKTLRDLRDRLAKIKKLLRKADRQEKRQQRRIANGTLAKDKAVNIKRVFGKITSWTNPKAPEEE